MSSAKAPTTCSTCSSATAFMAPLTISHSSLRLRYSSSASSTTPSGRKTIRRSRAKVADQSTSMTLAPKDCSWKSEGDLRAIESEFYVSLRTPGVVDNDMHRLRRRMIVLGRKEKQWSDFCQQFSSLSVLTGIPMVDTLTGEPTLTAWVFLSLSAAVPLYVLSTAAQWMQSNSVGF